MRFVLGYVFIVYDHAMVRIEMCRKLWNVI